MVPIGGQEGKRYDEQKVFDVLYGRKNLLSAEISEMCVSVIDNSRNGAPSRKRCAVNGRKSKASTILVLTPPPPPFPFKPSLAFAGYTSRICNAPPGQKLGLLNMYFSDWLTSSNAACRLPFANNALRMVYDVTHENTPGYWNAMGPAKVGNLNVTGPPVRKKESPYKADIIMKLV